MPPTFDFYDEEALLERLSHGVKKRPQEVVFLVGAPMSSPLTPSRPGVPGVGGVIELIRQEFADTVSELAALDLKLNAAGPKQYHAAFSFLQGRRGQQAANDIVRKAVLSARTDSTLRPSSPVVTSLADEACRSLDFDVAGWNLNPETEHLGTLIAAYPERFGRTLLTTNFDPLLQVAIWKVDGKCYRTVLHADGNLSQTEAVGCHIVHLHGYWYGYDTLHTVRQLVQPRPRLHASLRSLLRNKLVVVCAYGGWDDAFTDALMDVVSDVTEYPEIIWTFFEPSPAVGEDLARRLEPGINRGRVTLYNNIDCNSFFPKLFSRWKELEPKLAVPPATPSNPVRFPEPLPPLKQQPPKPPNIIEGDVEDRPPLAEICVGRDEEMERLRTSASSVVFLTGIGGQGKSTLATRYFAECQTTGTFSAFVWRDCKEESDRFEHQIVSVIESLSGGTISAKDLAQLEAAAVIDILVTQLKDHAVLFVFDNIDHYISLDTNRLLGSPDLFVSALLNTPTKSRAVFTCRPSVSYDHKSALSCHLEGISVQAALSLFSERKALASAEDIRAACELTNGHAFWLDLLAVQVGRQDPPGDLSVLLGQMRSGDGPLPENTLQSIWTGLRDREQLVLRAMAETVRPESEHELGSYVEATLNYNKFIKSLKVLRALNLIVIKPRENAPDLLELHPLVRRFIQQRFTQTERRTFIGAIIDIYKRFIGNHRVELRGRPSLGLLQYWTQNVDLDIAAGMYKDAFFTLAEVGDAFLSSPYPREFCRAARALLSAVDWVADHAKYPGFELVFGVNIRILSHFAENAEVDGLLERYELTVASRDARYINYADLRCYSKWYRGDFGSAVAWGRAGNDLKGASGVDTKYDTSHNLALAERDAGQPEEALTVFLRGRSLNEVTDPEELNDQMGGSDYGNIGRCLHLMGQIRPALICYQKSALLIERDPNREHVLNQGYIRAWVGELLLARNELRLAYAFFRAARVKWEQVSPPRSLRMLQMSSDIQKRVPRAAEMDDRGVERLFLDWVAGENLGN
jgi:tetratricopeptide (TPR) repeat protein